MPLGVFYLASSLRQRGHEVAVIDGEAENLTAADISATRRAVSARPGGHQHHDRGVSSGRGSGARTQAPPARAGRSSWAAPTSRRTCRTACRSPSSISPSSAKARTPLAELADALERGTDLAAVASLAYRKGDCRNFRPAKMGLSLSARGELVVNPPAPRVDDLDALPFPAYDLAADLVALHAAAVQL